MRKQSMGISPKHPVMDTIALWEGLRGHDAGVDHGTIYKSTMDVIHTLFSDDLSKYESYLRVMAVHPDRFSLTQVLSPIFVKKFKGVRAVKG